MQPVASDDIAGNKGGRDVVGQWSLFPEGGGYFNGDCSGTVGLIERHAHIAAA